MSINEEETNATSDARAPGLLPSYSKNKLLYFAIIFGWIAVALEHPIVLTLPGAHPGEHSYVFNWETPISLMLEIAFACFVAWVVSTGNQRETKQRDQKAADALRKQISEDVFLAVLSLTHGADYAKRVYNVALRAELMREFIDLTYDLDPLAEELATQLGVDGSRFVVLTSKSRFRFRNASSQKKTFPLQYAYSIRAGKLKEFNKVTLLEVRSKGFSENNTPDQIKAKTSSRDQFYDTCKYEVTLDAEESVDITIHNCMIKERSDNEVWATFYPTKRTTVMVNSRVTGISIGLRALTAGELVPVVISPNGSGGEWRVEEPMLPYDSIILWWRTAEDDTGVPPAAPKLLGVAKGPESGDQLEPPVSGG